MNETDNMIMPPYVALTFFYSDRPICSVPVFVLVLLARDKGISDQNQHLNALNVVPDDVAAGKSHVTPESCLSFLQNTISWDKLVAYLSCPSYLSEEIRSIWSGKASVQGLLSISFRLITVPDTVYRYMTFNTDRAARLLVEGKLFMPCPAMFNDPFDCSLDEATRLTFIEAAIGCFSTVPDDVLMFSHYADNHRGVAVGFNTRRLIGSLTSQNIPIRADIRPVWYFPTMPRLDLTTQPALCATCKSDIWRHENEFRVFMAKGSSLVPSGVFAFDREAITEVICGCRAQDDTVAVCKSFTDDLATCKRKKAVQMPNRFGVQLHEIRKT